MLNFSPLKQLKVQALLWMLCSLFSSATFAALTQSESLVEGSTQAVIIVKEGGDFRTYELTSNAELRDNRPPEKEVTFSETPGHATVRTGNVMFDGLYAMAVHEAVQNSVSQIKNDAYGNGAPI